MSEAAEIVIIGGGVVGSSIAFNLRQDGFNGRIVVVEKDAAYRFASSALAMGGVRQQFMSRVNIEMVQYSVGLLKETPECSFRQRGYLFLANESNWPKLKKRHEVQSALGGKCELLAVADIRKLVPELRCDDLVGALFGPEDGYVDPRATLRTFRRKAEQLGVVYVADEVTGIEQGSVSLAKAGRIPAGSVVIAAGAWSGVVAGLAGVTLPVTPVRQQLFRCRLPRPWGYEFPMTVDPGGTHWRHDWSNEIVIAKTRIDEPAGVRFGCDLDRYETDVLPDLIRRLPEFRELKLVFGWGGLYEMTADHNGIIDRHPEKNWLYFAAGFSGHGLMMSAATGKLLSELIRTGSFQTVDASPLNYSRFEKGELFWDEAMI